MEHVGTRIQQARDRAVLTRTELARAAKLSYDAILLIETGRRTPTRATIRKIAAALDIDPYTLLEPTEA